MKLHEKNCTPSPIGSAPLSLEEKIHLLSLLDQGWILTVNQTRLERKLNFKNMKRPLELAVQLGALADEQKHHPNLTIGWGMLKIEIYTHTMNDLAQSDFILAAKYDQLILKNP